MPDDNYGVIDRSSITGAAGGCRTLRRGRQLWRSDAPLLRLDKEQVKVLYLIAGGDLISASADNATSTNVCPSVCLRGYGKFELFHLMLKKKKKAKEAVQNGPMTFMLNCGTCEHGATSLRPLASRQVMFQIGLAVFFLWVLFFPGPVVRSRELSLAVTAFKFFVL